MADKKEIKCPACNSKGFYTKKDGNRRCKKCGIEWSDKK
jgi:transposase-like protein